MSSWRIMMFPSIGTQLELYQLQLQNLNNGLVLVLHLSHSNGRVDTVGLVLRNIHLFIVFQFSIVMRGKPGPRVWIQTGVMVYKSYCNVSKLIIIFYYLLGLLIVLVDARGLCSSVG